MSYVFGPITSDFGGILDTLPILKFDVINEISLVLIAQTNWKDQVFNARFQIETERGQPTGANSI